MTQYVSIMIVSPTLSIIYLNCNIFITSKVLSYKRVSFKPTISFHIPFKGLFIWEVSHPGNRGSPASEIHWIVLFFLVIYGQVIHRRRRDEKYHINARNNSSRQPSQLAYRDNSSPYKQALSLCYPTYITLNQIQSNITIDMKDI